MFVKAKSAVASFFRRVKVGFKRKVDSIKRLVKNGIDTVKEIVTEDIPNDPKLTFLATCFLAVALIIVARQFVPANVVRGLCVSCLMFISGSTVVAWRNKKHMEDLKDVVAYAGLG